MPDNPSPVEVAEFVVGSLGKHPNGRAHAEMLRLLDWLIAMRSPAEVTPPARWAPRPPRSGGHDFPLGP